MTKLLHLQGIRGIAICSVIAFHYFPDYFPNGYLGVDLFFVLSGYLMSMMLSRHSSLNFPIIAEFLYRRIKRIVPLYYLVVIISTVVIYFCPCSELITNMISSDRAIWLSSNLYYNSGDDYFEKMGAAHDLFTHTWSLCLEMQFYIIFPVIWWLQIRLSQTRRMLLLHLISAGSLYFYLISDSRESFNNMFCRIWQFLFGNMVYCLENGNPSPEQEPSIESGYCTNNNKQYLLEANKGKEEKSSDWIFASLSLVILIYSTVTKQHLAQDYSRMTTTILSIILIHFGRGFSILENASMVFLGEISYAWYLFHWPMLSLQKIFEYITGLEMFLGIIASFGVAVIAHYSLEKPYLIWGKSTIIPIVSLLFFSCLGLEFFIGYSYLPSCSVTPVIKSDYAQMSIEERKLYYAGLMNHDVYQLTDERCIYDVPKDSSIFGVSRGNLAYFQGHCKYTNSNTNNNRTLAIIGNSWVANTSPLVFDECSKYFENIHRTAFTACEALKPTNTTFCQESEKALMESVEQLKPDYLIIIQRYYFSQLIYSEKEWEESVKVATERLGRLSSLVKEKIFILHTFPLAYLNKELISDAIDGTTIDWTTGPGLPKNTDMSKAQEKLDQIIGTCSKCEQFDFSPQFTINGTFYPYDPGYFVPYVNPGLHFTQPGLERIRPVFTDICNRIGH